MRRSAVVLLLVCLAGCGGAGTPAGGGSTQAAGGGGSTAGPAAGGGGGDAAAIAAAAAKVTDWCALIPQDIITSWAPGAGPATAGTYPMECGASNGTQALDFRYTPGFGHFETPNPATVVSGLPFPAYAQNAAVDETQLWVVLADTADANAELFIDVAGHDGRDHQADAVNIAKAVLAKLGG